MYRCITFRRLSIKEKLNFCDKLLPSKQEGFIKYAGKFSTPLHFPLLMVLVYCCVLEVLLGSWLWALEWWIELFLYLKRYVTQTEAIPWLLLGHTHYTRLLSNNMTSSLGQSPSTTFDQSLLRYCTYIIYMLMPPFSSWTLPTIWASKLQELTNTNLNCTWLQYIVTNKLSKTQWEELCVIFQSYILKEDTIYWFHGTKIHTGVSVTTL